MKLNKHTLLYSQRRFCVYMHLNDSCSSKKSALFLALEVVCDLWELLSLSWTQLGELSHLRYFVLPCPKLQQPQLKGLVMGHTFKYPWALKIRTEASQWLQEEDDKTLAWRQSRLTVQVSDGQDSIPARGSVFPLAYWEMRYSCQALWRHGLLQQVITEEEGVNLEAASSSIYLPLLMWHSTGPKQVGSTESWSALLSNSVT